jgi:succinate-acetate transporter protein
MSGVKANPAPLGLMGFGMTTFLLNIHNAGFYPVGSMILSMGFFYGGLAQIIAGIMEFQNGNTFATTAFTSYGIFWWTLVSTWSFPKIYFEKEITNSTEGSPGSSTEFIPLADKPPIDFLAWYLFMWGLFTFFMFIGTLKKDYTIRFVFGSLTLLFWLLAIRDWLSAAGLTTASNAVGKFAGWEGIVCGLSAMYYAMAQVINEQWGRSVMPIGAVAKASEKKFEGTNEEQENLPV